MGALTYLMAALTATIAEANIILHWVQPSCDFYAANFTGCLRGQICTSENICITQAQSNQLRTTEKIPRGAAPLVVSSREDNRCGRDYDNAECDTFLNFGSCCSQYGYCGYGDAYCLPDNGCQSGCADDSTTMTTILAPTDSGEPVIGSATRSAVVQSTGHPQTTDGTCGARLDGTICGNWPQGACCSMYGYCGKSNGHCGAGCQSGPCDSNPSAGTPGSAPASPNPHPGSFEVVGQSGVPAMHAGLLPNGRVMFLDKVENYTQVSLDDGQYAYSCEYNPTTNECAPLSYQTNAFCSGGISLADGTMVSLGGNAPLPDIDPTVFDGFDGIRYLYRSSSDPIFNGQSWAEPGNKLASNRWYASAQILAEGTIFVASGSTNGLDPSDPTNNNPTFEILDSNAVSNGINIDMEILQDNQPYYMYPFIHLLRDGSLFIFVSKSCQLFDPQKATVISQLPDLSGDYRTYPNTGGSVLLPLSSAANWDPDILVCGGGAYQDISSPTDPSCGRIRPLDDNPQWELDSMTEGRAMVEGTLLPDGTVVWLNGCNEGAQGFGLGAHPEYVALIYDPTAPLGKRWHTDASSAVPRLYHSVALLLLDGTLLIAGSNPNEQPVLVSDTAHPFPTEFRVEIYTPPYLSGDRAHHRPTSILISSDTLSANGSSFQVDFNAPENPGVLSIVMYYGGFVTHSLHMGHRMLVLDFENWTPNQTVQQVAVTMPPDRNVAPPGPYVIYVVVDGTPGIGQFVSVI